MAVLNKTYLLTLNNYDKLLNEGQIVISGNTIPYDPSNMHFINYISTEFFDTVSASKIFPSEAQKTVWDSIPSVQLDWNETDTTSFAYIKNKPTWSDYDYPVTAVKVNGSSVVTNKEAKINLSSLVTSLNTVEGNSLIGNTDLVLDEVRYQTTEPTTAGSSTRLRFVVLSSEPTQTLNGYAYLY